MSRARACGLLAAGLAAALPFAAGARLESAAAGSILVARVDSIIHPVSAEYMIDVIERADSDGAALVVFTLETPGGLVDSTRSIVTRMLAARTRGG